MVVDLIIRKYLLLVVNLFIKLSKLQVHLDNVLAILQVFT